MTDERKQPPLEVLFATKALEKRLGSDKSRRRELGDEVARKLARRLDALRAAPNLEAMRNTPGRCHETREDREGQLALDLKGGLRLVFEQGDEPIPRKPDGGLDWSEVEKVLIREVTDYHG